MTKSNFVGTMDEIQASALVLLKPLGYRKRGRTFNRDLESGLVHVVNFQMGQYPVGDQIEILPYRPNLYGYFTVNLGVFIPEVHTITRALGVPAFVKEYDCEIRQRLGRLLGRDEDIWWSLDHDVGDMCARITNLLSSRGLPYLDQFCSHDDIINQWEQRGAAIGLPPRAGLTIAIILASEGQAERARHLMLQEYAKSQPKGYADFVGQMAQKMGMSLAE